MYDYSRLVILSVLLAACPETPPVPSNDTSPSGDTADAAETPSDGAAEATDAVAEAQADSPADAALEEGAPETDAAQTTDPFGFNIRVPKKHTVSCKDFGGTPFELETEDTDYVCTFAHAGETGAFYVQATPTGCNTMVPYPIFEVKGAWLSKDGKAAPADKPFYDYGGNHNNDFATFDRSGKQYKYYHSSFGFGFRKCQPMDCLQVFDPGTKGLLEDGCTKDRTLPVVCVQVGADGKYAELKDAFAKCPGDPNGP